jgi:hypothetical protein
MTEFTPPDEIINSQYGAVPFRVWCEREVERINSHGKKVEVVKLHKDMPDGPFNPIALSR